MSRDYTVTVECPRCSTEFDVTVTISGGYRRASRLDPAEYPEIDFVAPTACTHEPDAENEFTPGPYTAKEQGKLDTDIEYAATQKAEQENESYAADGPEDDS